jgi:DNA transformation protein and related proteins
VGAVAAYRLIKARQPAATLNLLWALAAALEEKDWRELSEVDKQQLQNDAQ